MVKYARPALLALLVIFGIWYGFYALSPQWARILNWQLTDSDDITRTLEVRAWLDGQGFYDRMLHRSNPPFGGELHWSRLSDAPLALVELILRPFFGAQQAEIIGVFFTPLLLGLVFTYCAYLASKPLYNGRYNLLIALFVVVFFRALGVNFAPGRVDHHGLQLISFALFLYGITSNDKKGGIIAGIALAASLTIGLEMLLLEIIGVLWLVLMWALNSKERAVSTQYFGVSLFISIIVGLLINVAPYEIYQSANERLSIAQAAPIAIGALLLAIVARVAAQRTIKIRLVALFIIALPVIGIATQFPILLKPLYWQVSPTLYKYWFIDIGETFPLLKMGINKQIILGGFSVLVLIAGAFKAAHLAKNTDTKFYNFLLLIVMLLVCVVMTFWFQARVNLQAAGLATIISIAILSEAVDRLPKKSAILLCVIVNPFVPEWALNLAREMHVPFHSSIPVFKVAAFGGSKCYSKPNYATLNSLPKGLVANNIAIGSYVLINTHHDVITTPFHRDMGRDYLFNIYLSDDETAQNLIKQRGINYLVYCGSAMELRRIAEYSPNSFMAHVLYGKAPNYLEKVPDNSGSDLVIYRVK
ncbi:hypothetical protein [Pseudaquidulcibacter saccharophilus]|uniref:hypothetical protein n=1 Tax=Pseudaquidulcibacter saccharophilus TaxID=2831900 RepID=UPI001EFF333D|nr:hypothetical protein [Pseudaquidulcibacter saccharophilus]